MKTTKINYTIGHGTTNLTGAELAEWATALTEELRSKFESAQITVTVNEKQDASTLVVDGDIDDVRETISYFWNHN